MEFKKLNLSTSKVLVIGDVMIDSYIEGETERISPEAPVPIVKVTKEIFKAGGAANVAVNLSKIEAQVGIISIIGKDKEGSILKKILKENRIENHFIESDQETTIKKLRIVSSSQQLIRLDFEKKISRSFDNELVKKFESVIKNYNVIVFSDYAKGVLKNIKSLIKIAKENNKITLIDPKKSDFSDYSGADIITPNKSEFEAVCGKTKNSKDFASKANKLLKNFNINGLLVTLGSEGISLFEKKKPPFFQSTIAREVYDVTGAGDTVIAIMAACLSINIPLKDSVKLANIAAGIVVGKFGTSYITKKELDEFHHKIIANNKILHSFEDLKEKIQQLKKENKKIVMTNGCFDILHAGHIDYLNKARMMGDSLLVAINTDSSVKKLKGSSRPINNLSNRISLLNALESVDMIIPFEESTPISLIKIVMPDFLVKGADYKVNEVVGADYVKKNGGEVVLVDLVEGLSTTKTIKKIKDESIHI